MNTNQVSSTPARRWSPNQWRAWRANGFTSQRVGLGNCHAEQTSRARPSRFGDAQCSNHPPEVAVPGLGNSRASRGPTGPFGGVGEGWICVARSKASSSGPTPSFTGLKPTSPQAPLDRTHAGPPQTKHLPSPS